MYDTSYMTAEEQYIITRWLYSIGAPPLMTDAEYSNLHQYLKLKGSIPEYTERSWSSDPCPHELLKKFNMEEFAHNIVLGDKTESIDSLTSEFEVRNYYSGRAGEYLVSFKIDGWNIQLHYHNRRLINMHTRGRLRDAMDINFLKPYFPEEIGIDGSVKIVCELCLSSLNYEKLKELFPNKNLVSQRSSVSTALANEQARHLLSFLAFDIILPDRELTAIETFALLKAWGFETPRNMLAHDGSAVIDCIRTLSESKYEYPYISDGCVVRSNIGRDLRAARIYNWEESIYKSYITGIKEEHSSLNFGTKLLIYPIRTMHNMQTQINITNIDRIQKYRLFKGTPIAFSLTSDAIADIDLSTTVYLQELWKGRYEEYQKRVIMEEAVKYHNNNKPTPVDDFIGGSSNENYEEPYREL